MSNNEQIQIESCKVLNRAGLLAHLGISEKNLFRLERLGDAPPKVRLSEGRVGYRATDVSAWLASRRESQDIPAARGALKQVRHDE